jgi:GNAT superfamily N-acetyltransferase
VVVVVAPLASHPELVPITAEWHFREWGHTDPGSSVEAWTAAMTRQVSDGASILIALADGSAAGVVGLVAQDMPGYGPAAGLTPWVKGLYVDPSQRRKGAGTLLMHHCETMAASLGNRSLYLYTERGSPAQALYERLNWHAIHVGRYDGIGITVMRTSLGAFSA